MRTLVYSFQTAFKSIWHEKWINLLTILSVSIGLLILSSFVTATLNVDSVLKRWSKSFGLVVYLDENLSKDEENRLKNYFQEDTDVLEVIYISKERAVKELEEALGENAQILEDLNENPLPSSFELKLRRELLDSTIVKKKSAQIEQITGVEEVQYGEKWLSSLNKLSEILKVSAIFVGCSILIAIIFITYNTIKIFFYRRKDEIETVKLMGATKRFIRMPFLIEGFIIGLLGGIIGSLTLLGINSLIALKGVEFMPSIKSILISVPVQIYLSVPAVGALMSFIGSFIAVGKIKY